MVSSKKIGLFLFDNKSGFIYQLVMIQCIHICNINEVHQSANPNKILYMKYNNFVY